MLENAKLPMHILIFLIYEWSIDSSVSSVAYEYDISASAVSNWFGKFRALASVFIFKMQV